MTNILEPPEDMNDKENTKSLESYIHRFIDDRTTQTTFPSKDQRKRTSKVRNPGSTNSTSTKCLV